MKNFSFTYGETLTYRAHVGFIHAAEATFQISDNIYKVDNSPCFKIDIHAKTLGLFDVVSRVRDNWGTLMDTVEMVPRQFYRYIEEGKYRKNEIVNFDHSKRKASVHKLDKQTKKVKEIVDFPVPENVQDLVSGYYYFRLLDFSKAKKGDTLSVRGFFDDELYDMKIVYLGKEKIETKVGTFNAMVFSPIIKKNKLFGSDDPLRMWISDDKNRIPLRIKANLFIGSLDVDLRSYENLRHPLNLASK
jgi:hypothetical protein